MVHARIPNGRCYHQVVVLREGQVPAPTKSAYCLGGIEDPHREIFFRAIFDDMKKIISIIVAAGLCASLAAQELTVTYQVSFNEVSEEDLATAGEYSGMAKTFMDAMKDVVTYTRLVYKDGESEYRSLPPEDRIPITMMGMTIDISTQLKSQSKYYTYKDHSNGTQVEYTNLFERNYLVTDSLGTVHFTIDESQTKEILGFECTKAVSEDGKTSAWFSSQIPLGDEPILSGLEGLILEYSTGMQTFTATEILESAATSVVKPEKGKEITRARYKELAAKAMGGMGGGMPF